VVLLLGATAHSVVSFSTHISILEQEFERRAITEILFGVLASEFHAESKNTNLFAGERHEFFGQKTKGGTLTVENLQCPLNFDQKKS